VPSRRKDLHRHQEALVADLGSSQASEGRPKQARPELLDKSRAAHNVQAHRRGDRLEYLRSADRQVGVIRERWYRCGWNLSACVYCVSAICTRGGSLARSWRLRVEWQACGAGGGRWRRREPRLVVSAGSAARSELSLLADGRAVGLLGGTTPATNFHRQGENSTGHGLSTGYLAQSFGNAQSLNPSVGPSLRCSCWPAGGWRKRHAHATLVLA
jgi:hypothetical protein